MASGVSPTRKSMAGSLPVNGQFPGQVGPGPSPTSMSVPGVDADKLKARLYSYAPQQAQINTNQLCFRRPTNSQAKKGAIPASTKLEPLVGSMLSCKINQNFSFN